MKTNTKPLKTKPQLPLPPSEFPPPCEPEDYEEQLRIASVKIAEFNMDIGVLKERKEKLMRKVVIPICVDMGVRASFDLSDDLELRYVKGRKQLSKDKLRENGVSPLVIAASMNEGAPHYEVRHRASKDEEYGGE